jgi:hypothetical protein
MKNVEQLRQEFDNASERVLNAVDSHLYKASDYLDQLEGETASKENQAKLVKAIQLQLSQFDEATKENFVPSLAVKLRRKILDRTSVLMAKNAITEGDVENATLFETSTGRKAVRPRFPNRNG